MKTYVDSGKTVTLTAPAAVTSGAGILVGSLFGVAQNDAENGGDLVIVTQGTFDLVKVGSQAWTVGAKVYWDSANSRCTTSASGNTLIGVATEVVGSGASLTTGRVRLGIVA